MATFKVNYYHTRVTKTGYKNTSERSIIVKNALDEADARKRARHLLTPASAYKIRSVIRK
jgi:hypothetical protein